MFTILNTGYYFCGFIELLPQHVLDYSYVWGNVCLVFSISFVSFLPYLTNGFVLFFPQSTFCFLKKKVCKVMWALSNFSYFPMRYLSCIQMFCSIMHETSSSSILQFFISSESSNQCFCEKEVSFRAGLSNTFLCPNERWLVGSFLKDTQGRSCTVRLLPLSVNSVHTK